MEVAYIQTPIGVAELKGDKNGLASVTVLNNKKPIGTIPTELKEAAEQFQQYFNGNRTVFNLKLNPSGTDFLLLDDKEPQSKVDFCHWPRLLHEWPLHHRVVWKVLNKKWFFQKEFLKGLPKPSFGNRCRRGLT